MTSEVGNPVAIFMLNAETKPSQESEAEKIKIAPNIDPTLASEYKRARAAKWMSVSSSQKKKKSSRRKKSYAL